jgi:hypothetical protein
LKKVERIPKNKNDNDKGGKNNNPPSKIPFVRKLHKILCKVIFNDKYNEILSFLNVEIYFSFLCINIRL